MRYLFIIMTLCFVQSVRSQSEGTIKGNIVDLEMGGEPLLFANVSLAGTGHTTQTNFNGNYEMAAVRPGTYTLEISSLGYESVKLPVEVKENAVVQVDSGLGALSISLEEVTTSSDLAHGESVEGQSTIVRKRP